MTDPITCPECEGTGETLIGPIRVQCRFCHGHGTVGGDNEPAEGGQKRADGYRQPEDGEEYDRDIHGPLPAVWDHPTAKGIPGCPTCLGAGVVINLGDIYRETTGTMVQLPCPRCRQH